MPAICYNITSSPWAPPRIAMKLINSIAHGVNGRAALASVAHSVRRIGRPRILTAVRCAALWSPSRFWQSCCFQGLITKGQQQELSMASKVTSPAVAVLAFCGYMGRVEAVYRLTACSANSKNGVPVISFIHSTRLNARRHNIPYRWQGN